MQLQLELQLSPTSERTLTAIDGACKWDIHRWETGERNTGERKPNKKEQSDTMTRLLKRRKNVNRRDVGLRQLAYDYASAGMTHMTQRGSRHS